jgi:NADP-dependent 3-hydroxy acid dehydrogenase YdfG
MNWKEADVKVMIDHAVDRFGRLDCLMNNAGRGSQFATIADADLEQFDAVIAVHLRAVLAGMKYAARVMAVQGTGSIINGEVSVDVRNVCPSPSAIRAGQGKAPRNNRRPCATQRSTLACPAGVGMRWPQERQA